MGTARFRGSTTSQSRRLAMKASIRLLRWEGSPVPQQRGLLPAEEGAQLAEDADEGIGVVVAGLVSENSSGCYRRQNIDSLIEDASETSLSALAGIDCFPLTKGSRARLQCLALRQSRQASFCPHHRCKGRGFDYPKTILGNTQLARIPRVQPTDFLPRENPASHPETTVKARKASAKS